MLDAGGEAMLAVPGGCDARGASRHLPLHRAARSSPSPAVVTLLLAREPAGLAWAKTAMGRTPLVFVENHNTGPGAAEIDALLRAGMQ
jgi:hypothetical protein